MNRTIVTETFDIDAVEPSWRSLEVRHNRADHSYKQASQNFWNKLRKLGDDSSSYSTPTVICLDSDKLILYHGRTYSVEYSKTFLERQLSKKDNQPYKFIDTDSGGNELKKLLAKLETSQKKFLKCQDVFMNCIKTNIHKHLETYRDKLQNSHGFMWIPNPLIYIIENEARQYIVTVDNNCNVKWLGYSEVLMTNLVSDVFVTKSLVPADLNQCMV